MKIKKVLSLIITCSMILGFLLTNIYAQENKKWKVSGDIVAVEYNLKKPIGLFKTDKKIKFKENDILNKISYIDRKNNKELKDINISSKKDVLRLYKLPDDIDIITEVIREDKYVTVYAKIYDLRNIVWEDSYIKLQVITSMNEENLEVKLNWMSCFNNEVVENINVYKCDMPAVYRYKNEYRIKSTDTKSILIGQATVDYLGRLKCKVNNKNDVKYSEVKNKNNDKYYLYLENTKDYKVKSFEIKLENTDSKYFKQAIINDINFKKIFNTNNFKSGIEGAPVIKNGSIVGSISRILKIKDKYVMLVNINN